jgi:hypothetical protein
MKKITTTRKSNRRPARERKNPNGVQNQLSVSRSKAVSKKAKNPDMNTGFEKQTNEETALAVAEAPKIQQAKFTRGQLGKAKRAFVKADQPEVGEEVRKKWLTEMKEANVAVMEFSSSRLAKVIKGELTASELNKAAEI